MTTIYGYAGLSMLLVWAGVRLLSRLCGSKPALVSSIIAVAFLALIATDVWLALVAVLDPVGAVLPALAVRDLAKHCLNYRPRPFSNAELTAVLLLYTAFLAASMGVFFFDPYRYGYAPLPAGAIAAAMLAYALTRRQFLLAAGLLAGQIAWALDIGSTNYFDHVLHVLLIPAIATVLIKSATRSARVSR